MGVSDSTQFLPVGGQAHQCAIVRSNSGKKRHESVSGAFFRVQDERARNGKI